MPDLMFAQLDKDEVFVAVMSVPTDHGHDGVAPNAMICRKISDKQAVSIEAFILRGQFSIIMWSMQPVTYDPKHRVIRVVMSR